MKISHILHPTDFSDCSRAAFEYARGLALAHNAKLTLMYVVEEISSGHLGYAPTVPVSDFYKDIEGIASKQLDHCCYEDLRDFKEVGKVIAKGVPDQEIVKYATVNEVDMIIMGTYGKTGMEFLFGSTTMKVLKRSKCPVLCVKGEKCQ